MYHLNRFSLMFYPSFSPLFQLLPYLVVWWYLLFHFGCLESPASYFGLDFYVIDVFEDLASCSQSFAIAVAVERISDNWSLTVDNIFAPSEVGSALQVRGLQMECAIQRRCGSSFCTQTVKEGLGRGFLGGRSRREGRMEV